MSNNLNTLCASRRYNNVWDDLSEWTIEKFFHNAGFVKKLTEGVNAIDSFDEMYDSLAVDYWEDINSHPSVFYKDNANLDKNVSECRGMSNVDIIAQLI